MRLGYSAGTLAGGGLTPAAYADLVRKAEQLGFDSAWSSEAAANDPVGLLGWLAGQTSSIKLGSAVLQLSGRSAVTAAASATTLAQVSGGRFILGVGTSGPQVSEGWHGQPYDRPMARTRDYLAVLRMALAGDTVRYAGQTLTLPLPGSQASALPFMTRRRAASVPVYLAGIGPRAVALAGELADGWIGIHCPPEYVEQALGWLRQGAAVAGRQLTGFEVAVMLLTMVDDDPELARDMVRPQLAFYVGGMGTKQANFYARLAHRLGFGDAAVRARDAYLAGRPDDAIDAVPDEMVDAMTLCGTVAMVSDRIHQYGQAGVGTLIMGMAAPSPHMRAEQLERIAELAQS